MSDVVLTHNCKLCRLLKTDKKLWAEVHHKVIEEGMTHTVVCQWLNSQLGVINAGRKEKIKEFNSVNFSAHFNKHITDEDALKISLRKMILSRAERKTVAFSDVEELEAKSLLQDDPEEDREDQDEDLEGYRFLQEYSKKARKNLMTYQNLIEKTDKSSPQGFFNNIEGFHKLLTELARVQESIVKMKASDKVAGRAVKTAVEMVVADILKSVVESVTEAEDMLSQEIKGSKLPREVSTLIKDRVGTQAKLSIEEVIRRVKKHFGIK